MKLTTLFVSLLAAGPVAATGLPDCLQSNYDAQADLFTVKNTGRDIVNQKCVLTVGPRGGDTTRSRLGAGSYTVSLANGGGGGAGGTQQRGHGAGAGGGGAGGGGAGARESVTRVDLAEGSYMLTIGAGGPGGSACVFAPYYMTGGPGWAGSPSNIVSLATGNTVAGAPGADAYARPSRAQHDKSVVLRDGRGGSGPGQTSGGHGGTSSSATGAVILAESGQSTRATTGAVGMGGIPGGNEDLTTAGGGGGATSRGDGGGGGGEGLGRPNRLPERGTLGSGGGGGEGGRFECDAGARGGHGFIAVRPSN